MKQLNVVFTGGGTGGHVFPGIAVVESLLESTSPGELSISWIGNRRGMEKEILKRFNIPFYSIPAGKLRRYFSFLNFIDIFRIIGGLFISIILLKKLKADLLFSKGGFVTVPPVIAAWLLKISVISHESDLDPGLASRVNSRFSDKMLFAYDETAENWRKISNLACEVTGNPVRKEIMNGDRKKGRSLYNIPSDKKVILVLGGSQGALEINKLVEGIIDKLILEYFVIHQMGSAGFKESNISGYITAPIFNSEFPDILAASDLVISRSGAGTLWENGVTAKPSVLIPLGNLSSRGDQLRNADYFERKGAAIVLKDKNKNSEGLLSEIKKVLNNEQVLMQLGNNVKMLCNPNSAEIIAKKIILEKGDIL